MNTEPNLTTKAFKTVVVLLHHPVTNRGGEPVTTSITNMDIHDLSRTCRTYEVDHYFLVNPIPEQHAIVERIFGHWRGEKQKVWHPDRFEALSRTELLYSFADVKRVISEKYPEYAIEVAMPDARPLPDQESYQAVKSRWESEAKPSVKVVVLGTGGGVSPEFYSEVHTFLAPLYGPFRENGYNHLSVRAAGAVILDRLFGK